MKVLFVSDYVCPYCLVAKEALHQALEAAGMKAEIQYHPFELTPESKPQVDTYHDETRKAHYQVLVEPCRELGLAMKLPPCVVPRPYTRMAFEGYFYAQEQGKGEVYNDLLYRAYFIEEKDIGKLDVLCDLAEASGLDPQEFRQALEERKYKEQLQEANRYAREVLQVQYVPTIYVDGKKVEVTQYTKEEFLSILGVTPSIQETGDGLGVCGEDGCSLAAHRR